jgi:hypothetical protein
MFKGHDRQSNFALRYAQGIEEGLRFAILAIVDAQVPGLRDKLQRRLTWLPRPRLEQLVGELAEVHDEGEVRAALDRGA